MSRYIGPKNKLSRAVGQDLGLKTNGLKVARRLSVPPGQHGAKSRRRNSDYGAQLKEKQKLRFTYGITEKQLHKTYERAIKSHGNTGEMLLVFLESRLDNVVYRAGLAPTRASARQIVNHGHVYVNQKRLSIPSYQVKVNDVITLSKKAMSIPVVSELIKEEPALPAWLQKKSAVVKVARKPERVDITEVLEEQLVVEYYSR